MLSLCLLQQKCLLPNPGLQPRTAVSVRALSAGRAMQYLVPVGVVCTAFEGRHLHHCTY